jgi:redox-sensitive bicupin YhaK (pirin superfamily)
MLWAEDTPRVAFEDEQGNGTRVILLAGTLGDEKAQAPAPNSWAADNENSVAIWIIEMDAHARWTLPAASSDARRTLYFFEGEELRIDDSVIADYHAVEVVADRELMLHNGAERARILLLQGRPIDEPVVQYGPFVMNTRTEIQEAFEDYQRNQFGGWPWERPDPVHPRARGRFARYANGKEEIP